MRTAALVCLSVAWFIAMLSGAVAMAAPTGQRWRAAKRCAADTSAFVCLVVLGVAVAALGFYALHLLGVDVTRPPAP